MPHHNAVSHGLPLSRDSFSRPPLEMGIVPFWFWNGDLEPDELAWQLQQYYDRGVRSLFIHGRMGLKVPYLSDAWFDRVKFVVEKGKEIGIDCWVYDEMDWPSGTADGQVLEADPELSQRYLELVALHIEGPLFTFLEAHDDRYVNTGDAHPIAAYGVPSDQYESGIREVVDLNKNLSWEKTLPWEAPEGPWTLMYFLEKRAPFYIDTLNPAATEKFIELTHERYRAAVGHEFGKAVPGFFTDEPAMYYYHVGLKNYVIPWSKQLFKIFRERRGYDLKPYLPALYRPMGEMTTQIRYDFWRTLTEQYAETYYKRIRTWCEENGLVFTGHLLFEELLRLAARCEGNLFRYLEQMHLIGVDHLYPKIGSEDEPEQHAALKLASSAAHHFGSARLLCESMGGCYWDCTLERMKWMNNWEYVLGVNLFNNHGYHYSIEGDRKRDWPPSQFYHHTWWPYYDRFTEYNARLSHLLSGGRHVAKVLMLYPINSIWTNYMPQEPTRVGDLIEADFNYLTDTLLRLHYDFDYVDEDVLAEATVEGDTIRIRDEVYSVFILPPVTHVRESTYEQLERFVAGGGTLITDALLPVELLETRERGTVAPLERFFGLDPRAELAAFEEGGAAFEVVHRSEEGNVFHFRGDGLHSKSRKAEALVRQNGRESRAVQNYLVAETRQLPPPPVEAFIEAQRTLDAQRKEALREALRHGATPDVTIGHEQVFYLHRVKDDHDVYFFVNTEQEHLGRVAITFEQLARPELWNPNTGETQPLPVYRLEEGRLAIELDFPPSEAHVIVLRGVLDEPHVTRTNIDVARFEDGSVVGYAEVPLDEAWAELCAGDYAVRVRADGKTPQPPIALPRSYAFRAEPENALLVERWKMRLEGEGDAAATLAATGADEFGWLDVTTGAWEMQLPQERDEEHYPVAVWYRAHVDVDVVPAGARLLVDGFAGSDHRLFLNGEEITEGGTRSRLDAEIREIEVGARLRRGRNTVALRLVVTRRTDGLLDLLKIVGDFGLAGSAEAGYRIGATPSHLEVGDWTEQGFPFFSGTGVYRAEVDVPASYLDGGRLLLEADCGEDVLEVRLNGSEGRVAPWHPYRIDVTDLVREGMNTIELRVTNTLINILEGVRQPSGLFGAPRLVHAPRYELVAGTPAAAPSESEVAAQNVA